MAETREEQSSHDAGANAIGRREAIRRTAWLLGGALSASSVAAVLAGCGAGRADDSERPRALNERQFDLVTAIAEHIIPATDTPGAKAAGVDRFIDTMLADYFTAAERERFLSGLADVNARARRTHGADFLVCRSDQQREVLLELDREAFPASSSSPMPEPSKETERGGGGVPVVPPAAPKFMREMKELTLLGYYTSEIGSTQEYRYVGVPGRFQGCVPLSSVGRAWA